MGGFSCIRLSDELNHSNKKHLAFFEDECDTIASMTDAFDWHNKLRVLMNFFANLMAAFWMLLGSTRAFGWVKPTFGQFVLFLILALSANILFAYLSAMTDSYFNEQGLLSYLVWPSIMVVAGIILAKRSLNYSLLFVPAILWLTADTLLILLQSGIQFLENKGWLAIWLHGILPNVFVLLFVWQTTALLWVFAKRLHWSWWERVLIPLATIALLVIWQKNVVNQPIFKTKEQKIVLGEQAFYAQTVLLGQAIEHLHKEQKGVPDWYFLGIAPYADQNVFASEVLQAQKLFDTQLGTQNRSISLINNPQTWQDFPIASRSNIERSLAGIAGKMNPQEDVLFMMLSSHGTVDEENQPTGELAVVNPPLELDQIDAYWLKKALDNSGIRWRVIVVSACYSGAFINPLKDPYTMIITASAADKPSFGCTDDADLTYFGRAFLEQSLADKTHDTWQAVFEHTVQRVGEKETLMGFEPSQPQMYLGAEMAVMLPELESRLFGTKVTSIDKTPQ